MHFDPDVFFGVVCQRVIQHLPEGVLLCAAKSDTDIAVRLIKYQHAGRRRFPPYRLRRIGSVVVLAQVIADDVPHGVPGGSHQFWRFPAGGIEKVFQIGRFPGVVVDACMVHHQREGLRPLTAQVKGAQKTVLQCDVGEVVLSGVTPGLVCCGLVAPTD